MQVKAKTILNTLNKNNYQAFFVGGCVRDSILRIPCNDIDIATSATPEQVLSIFPDAIPTGIDFGTVTVVIDGVPFEITTFRQDGQYNDNRRPDQVFYTSDITEDLSRRDFTINAMAKDITGDITDPFGGRQDLQNGIIKCVGNPDNRFSEDALRMLRAIRFATRFNFTIDQNTYNSIKTHAHTIQNVSKERINQELSKILLSKNPSQGIQLLLNTGLLQFIIPELLHCINFKQHNPHHIHDVFTHTLHVLDNVPAKLHLRLAALLHDIAKPQTFTVDNSGIGHFYGHDNIGANMAKNILKRLKFSNDITDKVVQLIDNHMVDINIKPARLLNKVGQDLIFDLISLFKTDIIAGDNNQEELIKVDKLKDAIIQAINDKQAFTVKDLAVNGNDIMSLGVKQGKKIGIILNKLLNAVLDNPGLNNRKNLISLAKKYITKEV